MDLKVRSGFLVGTKRPPTLGFSPRPSGVERGVLIGERLERDSFVFWDRKKDGCASSLYQCRYDTDPEERFSYLRFRVAEAKLSRQRPWRSMPCPSSYVIAGWVV